MQFQVPQNINLEDRIMGPFTALQFVILMIGGGTAYILLLSLPSPFNKVLGGFMAVFTIGITVGKFNDQPLYRFFKHILYFVSRPKTRVWHKSGQEIHLISNSPHKDTQYHVHPTKKVSKKDIAQLAQVLDSRGNQGINPSLNLVKKASTPHE